MASSLGVRVRLEFVKSTKETKVEKCWFFVDFSNLKKIRHLKKEIRDQFVLQDFTVELYMDGYLLPPQQPVQILHDGDLISVRLSKKIAFNNERIEEVNHNSAESLEIDTSEVETEKKRRKRKKRERKLSEEIIENETTTRTEEKDSVSDLEKSESTKKKRRRKRKKKKKEEITDQIEIIEPIKLREEIKLSPKKKLKMNSKTNHIRFDEEGNASDFPSLSNGMDVDIEQTSTGTAQEENGFDENVICPSNGCEKNDFIHGSDIAKKYENFPDLSGSPRVGDLIAFKELILSSDYTPQVSSYQEAQVLSTCGDNISLRITNKYQVPKLNGKFEVVFDEESDNNNTEELNNEYVTKSFSMLIEPKLVDLVN